VGIGSISPVVIAIVDSGSQLNHEDLADNIYPGGYDLVGCCKNNPQPDNDPNVANANASHGVHVSGLASASTNNGVGIASIAYNNAKLLIVKVSGDDFPSDVVRGYEGIVYAVDHGAKIINCSWGSPTAGGPYGQNIVNYAMRNDCLVVAAAGNGNPSTGIGNPFIDYPAAYPGVMAVASVSYSDAKSRFSNYGREVSISAPGENILSTVYDNTYGYDSGTSMAAPLVSSAAALLKMFFPSLTMFQIGERLRDTADNIDPKNPNYVGLLGKGRLNIYRALTNSEPVPDMTELLQNYPNPSSYNTYIDFRIPNDGQTSLMLYSIRGQLIKELVNSYLVKGLHHIPVYLGDLPAGTYIYVMRYANKEQAFKLIVVR
jgi:subtilisin family serine protease